MRSSNDTLRHTIDPAPLGRVSGADPVGRASAAISRTPSCLPMRPWRGRASGCRRACAPRTRCDADRAWAPGCRPEHPLGDAGDEPGVLVLHTVAEHERRHPLQSAMVLQDERVLQASWYPRGRTTTPPRRRGSIAARPPRPRRRTCHSPSRSSRPRARCRRRDRAPRRHRDEHPVGGERRHHRQAGLRDDVGAVLLELCTLHQRAIAGWAFRRAMISSGRLPCAASFGNFSTTPTAIVSRFV